MEKLWKNLSQQNVHQTLILNNQIYCHKLSSQQCQSDRDIGTIKSDLNLNEIQSLNDQEDCCNVHDSINSEGQRSMILGDITYSRDNVPVTDSSSSKINIEVKTESNEMENLHQTFPGSPFRVPSAEEWKSNSKSTNMFGTSSAAFIDDVDAQQQQDNTLSHDGSVGTTTGDRDENQRNGTLLICDQRPSHSLMKELRAELLDALWQKEQALSENRILLEKLNATEKTVKELTKTLESVGQVVIINSPLNTLRPSRLKKKKKSRKNNEERRNKTKESCTKREGLRSEREESGKSNSLKIINDDKRIVNSHSPVQVQVENVPTIIKKEASSPPRLEENDDYLVHVEGDRVMEEDHRDEDYEAPYTKKSKDKSKIINGNGGPTRAKRTLLPRDENGEKIRPSCPLCPRVCRNYARLKEHMAIHSGEKPYECGICSKAFLHKRQLDQHIRGHYGEKPFVCTVCGKAFAAKSVFLVHMRSHSGKKTFICSVCPKTFLQSGHLVQHMRIHTGQAPFTCSVCSKSFKLKTNLVQHERIHTGEKPFQCPTCGKMFNSGSQMNRHIRSHGDKKPFQCIICSKTFKEGDYLTRHMKTHSREVHACSFCHWKFGVKSHLTQHLKLHKKVGKLKEIAVS